MVDLTWYLERFWASNPKQVKPERYTRRVARLLRVKMPTFGRLFFICVNFCMSWSCFALSSWFRLCLLYCLSSSFNLRLSNKLIRVICICLASFNSYICLETKIQLKGISRLLSQFLKEKKKKSCFCKLNFNPNVHFFVFRLEIVHVLLERQYIHVVS